jgi:hypothetical protein
VAVSTLGTAVGRESCSAWNGLCSAIPEAKSGPDLALGFDSSTDSSTESRCDPIARLGVDLGSGLGSENCWKRNARVAEYAGYEACSHRSYRA